MLAEGIRKEVYSIDTNEIRVGVFYTVPGAAEALGKTVLTLKRWILQKIVPPPVFADTGPGYMHYSEKELQLIAMYLKTHFQTYDYLHKSHTAVINSIWQAVENHRKKAEG